MDYFSKKYKQTKKALAHYWNPNQNPTDKEKQALKLLDRADIDSFVLFMEENPDINLNVVDFNKASLLIKAQDVANNSNMYKKMFSDEELMKRAQKAVNYLLKRGVEVNYRDKNGITALLSACHWGNTPIAKILLQNGADVNIASNTNNFFTNPLLSAYFKKNLDLVILLLQYNADVQLAIELSNKGTGLRLKEEDINFLRSIGNIAVLVRKRKTQQYQNKNTVLAKVSDMVFEDITFNI